MKSPDLNFCIENHLPNTANGNFQNDARFVLLHANGWKREFAFIFLNWNINTFKIQFIFLWWNYGIHF